MIFKHVIENKFTTFKTIFAVLNITQNYPEKYTYCGTHNQGLGEKLWRISIVLGGPAYYTISVLLQ